MYKREYYINCGEQYGLMTYSKKDAHSDRLAHPFSDAPRRYIRRTTRDCRGCRSSRAVYRLGCSRSSGLVGRFLRLR